MQLIYSSIIVLSKLILPVFALVNSKIKKFQNGQKSTWGKIESEVKPTEEYLWVHAASLGEYEQGVPIINRLKKEFPKTKIVLTFFSPSGFEIKKNSSIADYVFYLPLDSKKNACKFIKYINPKMAFFIKYEFWPFYLFELKKQKIPTFLISGIFREHQIFFKSYGSFFRKALTTFDYFFLQNKKSQDLLSSINFNNSIISGDTRFERVAEIAQQHIHLEKIEEFIQNKPTIVVGSSWHEDIEILSPIINSYKNVKWIIAPHEITNNSINKIQKSIQKSSILFTDKNTCDLSKTDVLIVNTIGLLTKLYKYATISYVGGAFKTGLHNILEPATYGSPIIIGTNYKKFNEAIQLIEKGGCFSISTTSEAQEVITSLLNNNKQQQIKSINKSYIKENAQVSIQIIDKVCEIINEK